jgi:uncharacterized protein YutE (UPF0331/DUF86 family)
MTGTVDKSERRRLQTVARQYRKEGYDVVLQPTPSDLPDYLADFPIDLLAKNSTENVLVVVRSRSTLRGDCDIPRLAELVSRWPGWRLDLVVRNPRGRTPSEDGLELPTSSDVADRLAQVRELVQRDCLDAAVLLAWSAAEGALRRIARAEKIKLEDPAPKAVATQLYFLGTISREAYDTLTQAIPVRNALAHGYKTGHLEPEIIDRLVTTVEDLIDAGARASLTGPPVLPPAPLPTRS